MKKGQKVVLGFLGGAAVATLVYAVGNSIEEHTERYEYYDWARGYCNRIHKPLLTIGLRRNSDCPPDGDYTVDIDEAVLRIPGGVLASETAMPFPDKMFGVAYNSHTLEHLPTAEDIQKAIAECRRVADYAVLLTPSPYSITSNLFCPTHKFRLWLDTAKNRVIVKPSEWQTGFGERFAPRAMVTYEPLPMPAIVMD